MEIRKYITNKAKSKLLKEEKDSPKKYSARQENSIINIYTDLKKQKFLGFGASFTEASGYAYSLLSEEKKKEFINSYFSQSGLRYSLCRIPIGSTDFSTHSYSYAKKKDLSDFSIEEDKKYIIPLIKDALLVNPNITFIASPWSPPSFMKNTKMLLLGGKLLDKYKQTYADYFVKFIKAYEQEGIKIKYVTVQNEPNAIQLWESCLYDAEDEALFVKDYLYPTFKKNNLDVGIIIWDHNKEKVYKRAKKELIDYDIKDLVSGIGYHYYSGDHFENINLTSELFPDKLLIHTEGCTGYSHFNPDEEVKNGEIYAHDILGDLNNGSNGYIDWNMLLTHSGGPNHKKNNCNSPIMLTEDDSDLIKNMTYTYIGHFSKFINQDAVRLKNSRFTNDIEVLSFLNPDNSIVVVLLNRMYYGKEYKLSIDDKYLIEGNIEAHSIITLLIKE